MVQGLDGLIAVHLGATPTRHFWQEMQTRGTSGCFVTSKAVCRHFSATSLELSTSVSQTTLAFITTMCFCFYMVLLNPEAGARTGHQPASKSQWPHTGAGCFGHSKRTRCSSEPSGISAILLRSFLAFGGGRLGVPGWHRGSSDSSQGLNGRGSASLCLDFSRRIFTSVPPSKALCLMEFVNLRTFGSL